VSASNSSSIRLRGVTGALTRQVLEALREPGTVPSVMDELGLLRSDAWAMIKHLHEQGRVERLQRGVYRISDAGEAALQEQAPTKVKTIGKTAQHPPAGKGRTPARSIWLERNYSKLGHHRCAELLDMQPANVWAWARSLGVRFGDVTGYILMTDLSELLGMEYTALWSRAGRAGVLTYPDSVKGNQRKRKAMVPAAWADQVADEHQPPTPEDICLEALRNKLGLSKTQAARVAGANAYLRTPVSGGQPRLHISQETAHQITARYHNRRGKPQVKVVGREGVRSAIEASGPEGATERELYERLPCSRAAVRIHVRAMFLAGVLERCRLGDTLDPFVYRLIEHQEQPVPQKRPVVITGRPSPTPEKLGLTAEAVRSIREVALEPGRVRRPRGQIGELASRYGVSKAVIHRVLYRAAD
jgi:biotin operon repressor